jgi:hypothetical protein
VGLPTSSLRRGATATGSGSRGTLRVGIVLDSTTVPRWVADVVADVAGADFVEPVLLLVRRAPGRKTSRARKALRRLRGLLYSLYRSADRRLFDRARDPFAPVELASMLAEPPVELTRDELARGGIAANEFDVILRLGSSVDSATLAPLARHGAWSFLHGDGTDYRRDPPQFWEMYDSAPVSGALLEAVFEPSQRPCVIYRSYSATDPISLQRTRAAVYSKAARFPLRCLQDLHRGLDIASAALERPTDGDADGVPTNRQMVRHISAVGMRALRRQVRQRTHYEDWFIAYRSRRSEQGLPADMDGFQIIPRPTGRCHVDPFLADVDGRHVVFFEDYALTDRRGRICYCEIRPDGVSEPEVALEADYHLSYPLVFRWNGGIYMLPETSANRTIELYRAEEYPRNWVLEKVLVDDVVAVDATLLEHDGLYWMFTNIPVPGARLADELHVFWSDSPLGEWIPHPHNPVVSDARCARPAGAILSENGSIIRPTQDCSGVYGSAVVFRRIEELSRERYREVEVSRIEPGWLESNRGTHTYNRNAAYEVVDGRRFRARSWR